MNQEKALVVAFSVIVKTLPIDSSFKALLKTVAILYRLFSVTVHRII